LLDRIILDANVVYGRNIMLNFKGFALSGIQGLTQNLLAPDKPLQNPAENQISGLISETKSQNNTVAANALRELDNITGDRSLSDALIRGEVSDDAALSSNNSRGLSQKKKGRLADGGRYDQDIRPAKLQYYIDNVPVVKKLLDWAWTQSLKPVDLNDGWIRDTTSAGSEHGFVLFYNAKTNEYRYIKLFPELDPKSENFAYIKLEASFFDPDTGKFFLKDKDFKPVIIMHTHPFTTGHNFLIGEHKSGPSIPDFNTLHANPTAIGWIKARPAEGMALEWYFGQQVYPK
jgi:hypothetical protein